MKTKIIAMSFIAAFVSSGAYAGSLEDMMMYRAEQDMVNSMHSMTLSAGKDLTKERIRSNIERLKPIMDGYAREGVKKNKSCLVIGSDFEREQDLMVRDEMATGQLTADDAMTIRDASFEFNGYAGDYVKYKCLSLVRDK